MASIIEETTLSTISLLELPDGDLGSPKPTRPGASLLQTTTTYTRIWRALETVSRSQRGPGGLAPSHEGIETTQLAQAAEIAELRARSEVAVRRWYEHDVMGYSDFVAGVEGRIERVERATRRLEKAREEI
ncbi:hypothetical protein NPX13_g4105 [Xylaria arbuscula]|uniref:Uncharacterized protein n=1 Tax=Xylaria arbuscula TaxID=114810 RepID=A0A9W8NH51_9PEZI|nr:hypothetical protein NPX13_g4105 [Xylaria arbuscula]